MSVETNRLPVPGDRVMIHTSTGGCYDGLTGVITDLRDSNFQKLMEPQWACAHWWSVRLDRPADNGGKKVRAEIFLPHELHIMGTAPA